jgi:hypothetical protein
VATTNSVVAVISLAITRIDVIKKYRQVEVATKSRGSDEET